MPSVARPATRSKTKWHIMTRKAPHCSVNKGLIASLREMNSSNEGPRSTRKRGRHLLGTLFSFSFGAIAASTVSIYFPSLPNHNLVDNELLVSSMDQHAKNVHRNTCIETMKQCWLMRKQEASDRKIAEAKRAAERERAEAAQKSGPKITAIGLPQMKKGKKSASAVNEDHNPYNPNYPNRAIANEMARSDHYVVDSLAYLATFEDGNNKSYAIATNTESKPITLIVLTVNRSVPYLAVLVASLLRGNEPQTLAHNVNWHIINVERRVCKCHFQLFDDLEARLPFITFHDWSRKYSYTELSDFGFGRHNNSKAQFLGGQQIDYYRALKLCLKMGSAWCSIMEDDVILTHGYVEKFLQLVSKIKEDENILTVSSYNPYNDGFSKTRKISSNAYVESQQYEEDRTARKYIDPSTSKTRYQLDDLTRTFGISANSYPRKMIGNVLQYVIEKCKGLETDLCIMREMNNDKPGYAKKAASPSLANHIGHYSEHRLGYDPTFEWMSSDVRFQVQ